MRGGRYRVFLSHTSELRDFPKRRSWVQAAEAAVIRAQCVATDMAYFTARDVRPADYCRQVVQDADVYVGIIGMRYGSSVQDRPELSYTELEFETASHLGLPRLIFLTRDSSNVPALRHQSRESAARQRAFRERLQGADVTVAIVASPDELELRLYQALTELQTLSEVRVQPPEPRVGVPPDPIAHFVGRDAELAQLQCQLQRHRRVGVHGLGGIGKTQLVVRYLHQRYADYPDGVFWLRADQESSLVGDLASLTWRLGLPEREDPELGRRVEAVLGWLRAHERWLLVLDDLEPWVNEALRRWLPPGLPGHIVTTSRTPAGAQRLGLEPLPIEVATAFLLQRTGQADAGAASETAATLGCLPLALEQAAAYLEVTGRDLASYAEILRTRLVELMEEGQPEDYPRPVVTTWHISFERMESERPTAAALLRLCSFLAPDDIPIGVLLAGASDVPSELRPALTDEIELDRALAALRRYSLLEREGDGLRVHRLVQAVVRRSLGDDERSRWLAAAIRVLRAGFPRDSPTGTERLPICTRLSAHVQVTADLAAEEPVERRALGWLLDSVGMHLWVIGQSSKAKALVQRGLAIREQLTGTERLDTAMSLNNLSYLQRIDGEWKTAKAMADRALRIREQILGPDHPDTAACLTTIANVLRDQNHLDAARNLMERALSIREQHFGPDHPETAHTLSGLADVLRVQGELAAARSFAKRAVAIRERSFGPDDRRTANSLRILAMVLWDEGNPMAARPVLERALTVLLPDDRDWSPRLAQLRIDLAALLMELGDMDAAARIAQEALAVLERELGREHPWTIAAHDLVMKIASEQDLP